jgi:vacuolar protein-sorting-associated protein 4
LSADYLTIDNLRKLIGENIKKVSDAESGGDMKKASALCDTIIGELKLLADLDASDRERYLEIKEEWVKKKASLGSNERMSRSTQKTKNDSGLIDKMENEFRSRIESLISTADTKWSEIGGLDEEKALIREAFFFARATPSANVKVPKLRNMLLFGPPGTGKTSLAKAMSANIDATFFNANGKELVSRYVGDSERLVGALYETARARSPSIIFLDEVENLVLSRDNGNSTSSSVVQQFLSQLDGFGTGDNFVMTVAATNVPWKLDTAILSRFEKKIYVGLPDAKTREKILRINTVDKGFEVGLDLSVLSESTVNFSGRDLAFLCSEAIWHMLRRTNRDAIDRSDSVTPPGSGELKYQVGKITQADFDAALEKVKPVADRGMLERYQDWKEQYAGN